MQNGVEGRPNSISNALVKRDLQNAFSRVFANRRAGKRSLNLEVIVRRVYLSSRGAAVVSPIASHIEAELRIVDARTGKAFVEAVVYADGSDYDRSQPVGIISALTKLSVENDYIDTVRSYAEQVNVEMFGGEGAVAFPTPLAGDDES